MFALNTVGCAWLGSSAQTASVPSGDFSHQGQLNFPTGAKFVVVPFTAGVGVEATQELETIALMIVRGIADAMEESRGKLEVLTPDRLEEADFVIQGHVTELDKEDDGLMFWNKAQKKSLAVEALIRDLKTGRGITNFSTRKEVEDSQTGFLQLARQLGEEIGQELLERAN